LTACQCCILIDDGSDEDETAGESETETERGKQKKSLAAVTACEFCADYNRILSLTTDIQ